MRVVTSIIVVVVVLLSSVVDPIAGFNLPSSSSSSFSSIAQHNSARRRHNDDHRRGAAARRSSKAGGGTGMVVRLFSTLDRTPQQQHEESSTPALLVKGMKVGPPIPYSGLTVGVLKETHPGENRVSLAPGNVRTLVDAGLKVVVESGGECVFFIFFCISKRIAMPVQDWLLRAFGAFV